MNTDIHDAASTRKDGGKVVRFPRLKAPLNPVREYDQLTSKLVMARFREGTLPEGVLVALLLGAGMPA